MKKYNEECAYSDYGEMQCGEACAECAWCVENLNKDDE